MRQPSQASPDLSPISNTALLTPSDSPVTKSFDVKSEASHYGLGVFNGYPSDRLFDTDPPLRQHDAFRETSRAIPRSSFPPVHQRDVNNFPFLDPLPDMPSPIPQSAFQNAYPTPTHHRLESGHQQQQWTQQPRMRVPPSSGWVQAEERPFVDFAASGFAPEPTLRSSQLNHSGGKTHAHEVGSFRVPL